MKQAFQYNKSKQIELKNKSDFDEFAELLKEKKEIWIKQNILQIGIMVIHPKFLDLGKSYMTVL
ncbi:hypothetical protein DXA10_15000 [Firmicutes bacterium AM55-24TS]|nr:hypothetical protein DXA10_15000 [Firmicutes bacterium AM55-24TS]